MAIPVRPRAGFLHFRPRFGSIFAPRKRERVVVRKEEETINFLGMVGSPQYAEENF